jgi:transposase
VLASDAGSSSPEIARVLRTDENQVRRVIRDFNADGMGSLRPPMGGGRPRRIDDAARDEIRAIALTRPRDLGEPGTRWSLARLRRYLIRNRIVDHVDKEHLRRILQSLGITAQRTRTWKWRTTHSSRRRAGSWPPIRAPRPARSTGWSWPRRCGPISQAPRRQRVSPGRPARQRATYNRYPDPQRWAPTTLGGPLWGHLEKAGDRAVVLEFLCESGAATRPS